MKTATKEIGVGVIGVGMGRNMLRINDDPESTLVVRAICDVSPDAVRRGASEHNREALFETGDYREILDRSDIDVVGIYRLDHLHMQHLRDALESGKHVICTKPMVISLEEAKATVDPVRKTGKKLLVGQTCRFVPRFMAAKTLLDDRDLGCLLFAE